MDIADLMLHPIRLRIVHAMTGPDTQTTAELARRLTDVPKASLYRHVALLVEAGILEVVEERRVRGGVERRYRLHRERSVIDADTTVGLTRQDHRRGFSAAMAVLLAEFGLYLEQDDADPVADGVGYRQGVVWLTDTERRQVQQAVQDAVRAASHRQDEESGRQDEESEERRPYLMSLIMFPTEEPSTGGADH